MVRASLQQRWGRGHDHAEALKNCGIPKEEPHELYVFRDDSWDIMDDGTITWPEDSVLIKKLVFDRQDPLTAMFKNMDPSQ